MFPSNKYIYSLIIPYYIYIYIYEYMDNIYRYVRRERDDIYVHIYTYIRVYIDEGSIKN